MIIVACMPCGLAIRVLPVRVDSRSVQETNQMVGKDSDFWPDRFPCPRCDKMMTGMPETRADPKALGLMELRDLTPHEAFAAFNGFGLPEEQDCALESVQKLLAEQPVRKVVGTSITGMRRTIIDSLELWDGTRVYFGAGAEGACIYRIVRPTMYAEKVIAEGTNR